MSRYATSHSTGRRDPRAGHSRPGSSPSNLMPRFGRAGRSLNRSGKPTERKPGARRPLFTRRGARSPTGRDHSTASQVGLGYSGGPPASAAGPRPRRHTAPAATEATRIRSHKGRNRPTPQRGPHRPSIGPPGKTGQHGLLMTRGLDRYQPSSDHPNTPGIGPGRSPTHPECQVLQVVQIGSYTKNYNSSNR